MKTYQSISTPFLSITIAVDGKVHNIDFTGGLSFPYRSNGKFSTNNVKIQEALEKHSTFNKLFELAYETKEVKKNITIVEVGSLEDAIKELVSRNIKDLTEETVLEDNVIELGLENNLKYVIKKKMIVHEDTKIIPEITTVGAARDYLVDLQDGLTKSILKNMDVVLEEAKKRNISFPNLSK